MPTYKSTVKLTRQFHYEYRETVRHLAFALMSIIGVFAFLVLAQIGSYCGIIPRRHSAEYDELQGWLWLIAVAAALLITITEPIYRRMYPHIQNIKSRLRQKRIERLYGVPEPTLESRLEGHTLVIRVAETDKEERFMLNEATVVQTDNYIIIRPSRQCIAPFARSAFSEEELSGLISLLTDAGCDIMPNS